MWKLFSLQKINNQKKNLDAMGDERITQQSRSSSTDSLDTAEVRLDIKKFAQLLHSQQPHAEKMVFSM